MSHEIILLGGMPGSGKSTIARAFCSLPMPVLTRHLSIGERKRAIRAGEIASRYASAVQQNAHPERQTGTAPSDALTGIVQEFIEEEEGGLVILDGYPRYKDRVKSFTAMTQNIGADVLAFCAVEVPRVVARERLQHRPERAHQALSSLQDIDVRLQDHVDNVLPTFGILASIYGQIVLDGTQDPAVNAQNLANLYLSTTAQ
jgi:adenylate kinase family enzyme